MEKCDEVSGPNSCLNRAGDHEMLFVLRDKDEAAPGTIREWIRQRIVRGLNEPGDAKLADAERCARVMEQRQRDRLFGSGL